MTNSVKKTARGDEQLLFRYKLSSLNENPYPDLTKNLELYSESGINTNKKWCKIPRSIVECVKLIFKNRL